MEAEENVMVILAHDYPLWRAWKGTRLWPEKKGIHGWKSEGLKLPREYKPEEYDKP